MKRILLIALFSLATSAVSLQAQSFGGAVLDHDMMMPTDFASLSQTQAFGTSRSMAMGGAFTSLGADLSTVGINPAGLGMFSQAAVSITPMISIANSSTAGKPTWKGDSRTKFVVPNFGVSVKLSESSKSSVIALNAAFTYNRIADYNSRMSFSSESPYNPQTDALVPTIADVFMEQLAGANIYPSSKGDMDYDNNPYFWPAQSAYKTYLIDPMSDGAGDFWGTNVIGHNASVLSSYEVLQKGRADEYSFAIGGNIGNYLYFGATLGVQDIDQSTEYLYQEEYLYDTDGGYAFGSIDDTDPLASQANYSSLWQRVRLSGGGANLKLGFIARPTRALRIGAAFHSPTYYTLSRIYETSTETQLIDNSNDNVDTYVSPVQEFIDNYEYSWQFRTPSKLLLGASLQLGNMGIISLDYERQWYNWIRVSNAPAELTPYDYQQSYESNYKPVNTLRAGIEVKPVPQLALRAGGGMSTSMLKNESLFYSSPVATNSHYITCGVGFQFSAATSLDLAYQYHHQNYSSYRLFYVEYADGTSSSSDLFNSELNRHYISATLTFKL